MDETVQLLDALGWLAAALIAVAFSGMVVFFAGGIRSHYGYLCTGAAMLVLGVLGHLLVGGVVEGICSEYVSDAC